MAAALLVTVVLIAAVACGGGGDEGTATTGEGDKLKVVTSLSIFADFVRQVAGDRVEVTSLLPAGADPHTFEPTPKDVQELSKADVVFINGLGLEAPIEGIIRANVRGDAIFSELSEAFPEEDEPHLWLDATRAAAYVAEVGSVLVQADPGDEEAYRLNAELYIDTLLALDQEIQERIAAIPPGRRTLVATHNAFFHFAHRYGLELVASVTASPGQEPSASDIADLVRHLKEQGIPAVFTEPQVEAQGRVLERAAKEAGAQVCTLYSDALDDEVRSYTELMRFNAEELVRCLGGEDSG